MPAYLTLLALGGLAPLALAACGRSSSSSSGTTSTAPSPRALAREYAAPRSFGHEAGAAQASQIEATLTAYLAARAAGEWSAACSQLTGAKRHQLAAVAEAAVQVKGRGCASLLAFTTEKLPPAQRSALARAEVVSARVKGSDGAAIYALPGGAEYVAPMQLDGGEWKLADVGVKARSHS